MVLILDGARITYGTRAIDFRGLSRRARSVTAPELRGFNAGFIDYVGWGRFYWDGVSGFFGPALEDRAQRSEGRGRR